MLKKTMDKSGKVIGEKLDDEIINYYLKNVGINNARKFQSWLVGTVAQTGANPQRYMTETIKNMTLI